MNATRAGWSHLLEHLKADALPPGIKALGLTRQGREAALLLVLEPHALSAFSAPAALAEVLAELPLMGLNLVLREIPGALRATAYLPAAQQEALTPEQEALDPVVLGAQLQNGSADARLGGYGVGTLGTFAADAEGRVALISNNHVIAAENAGQVGDEVFQAQRGRGRAVAALSGWVPLTLDAPNRLDVACALLDEGISFQNAFLDLRKRPAPVGLAAPRIGTRIFKVGRTSGLTFGRVTAVEALVPRVRYGFGDAAFEGSFIVEGASGATFSAPGDSGSGVYDLRGRLLGFLYAGDGVITLACPAQEALGALNLTAFAA